MTWGGVITIVWLAGSIALGIGASDAWAGVVLGTADLVPLAAIFVLQKARKPGKEASKRDLPRASRPPNRLDD
jgi:hypothetical protein